MAKSKKSDNKAGKKESKPAEPKKEEEGKNPDNMTAQVLSPQTKTFKVKLPIRIAVIVLSVLALSWFFEGWRELQHGVTLAHAVVFISGTLVSAVLLWLQGFWIYLEEKYKGTLKRKIEHFEKLEQRWYKK